MYRHAIATQPGLLEDPTQHRFPGAQRLLQLDVQQADSALATLQGDASERCVSYLPLMNGPLKRKSEKSATPAYFHLKRLVGY